MYSPHLLQLLAYPHLLPGYYVHLPWQVLQRYPLFSLQYNHSYKRMLQVLHNLHFSFRRYPFWSYRNRSVQMFSVSVYFLHLIYLLLYFLLSDEASLPCLLTTSYCYLDCGSTAIPDQDLNHYNRVLLIQPILYLQPSLLQWHYPHKNPSDLSSYPVSVPSLFQRKYSSGWWSHHPAFYILLWSVSIHLSLLLHSWLLYGIYNLVHSGSSY